MCLFLKLYKNAYTLEPSSDELKSIILYGKYFNSKIVELKSMFSKVNLLYLNVSDSFFCEIKSCRILSTSLLQSTYINMKDPKLNCGLFFKNYPIFEIIE